MSTITTTTAVTRLRAELMNLEKDPPPHCKLYPVNKDDLFHWKAELYGPKDSPYEQGSFKLNIRVPVNYPTCAPTVIFETAIYHPNISETGSICVDSLTYWDPAYTLSKALLSIHLLLTKPNFRSRANTAVDSSDYEKKAKEETVKHAMAK